MCFLDSGDHERTKGAYHAALGALAFGAFAYNATAFLTRHQPHLAVNAVTYALLTAMECAHVQHHWERVR